jgi:hypothetical protein
MQGLNRLIASLTILAACASAQKSDAERNLSFSFHDGDDRIEIKVRGDDVEVLRNGEPAAANRFERDGNQVRWLDAKGRHRAAVWLNPQGGSLVVHPRMRGRLRLGVNLSELGDALAEHLRLDPGEVLYVTSVVDGQAAAKAGVRNHDVITRIDGRAPVDREVLRDVLQKKQAGQRVELEVLRRGEKVTIPIVLEEEEWSFTPYHQLLNVNDRITTSVDSLFYGLPEIGSDSQSGMFGVLEAVRDPQTGFPAFTFGRAASGADKQDLGKRLEVLGDRLERLEKSLEKLLEQRGAKKDN